uniref:Uncharacterized protein n=1 Tax=Trachysalambria curvirostris majanivirus TaxID=2984281 RepID=A0A9C7EZ01_9VIRU|nr:MAG: hypothetical protein [Trachysalambria curvirostris majanivirus]
MSKYNEDIRITCFKTCLLEYLKSTLSIFTEAISLYSIYNDGKNYNLQNGEDINIKRATIQFFKNVNINFEYIEETKFNLNIVIERDDKFCIEYIVYLLLAIDVFISLLSNSQDNNYHNKNNSKSCENGTFKRKLVIDLSCIDKNVLGAEKCKTNENSLYGFAIALLANRPNKPFSFLIFPRNKSCNKTILRNSLSLFFTDNEINNISKRIKTCRIDNRIKVIISKYRKKIKDMTITSNKGLIVASKVSDIIIKLEEDKRLNFGIYINLIDRETYTSVIVMERRTKQLNKSILDYLEGLLNLDKNTCPAQLDIVNYLVSFKLNIQSITDTYFPTLKFNSSRKKDKLSNKIKILLNNHNNYWSNNKDDNNFIVGKGNKNTNINNCLDDGIYDTKFKNSYDINRGDYDLKYNATIGDNSKILNALTKNPKNNSQCLDTFINSILPLLVNDVITNMWLNKLFLLDDHVTMINQNDIKPTGLLLSLLKKMKKETYKNKPKIMEILRSYSNVCIRLRNNRLPRPLKYSYNNPSKKQKINSDDIITNQSLKYNELIAKQPRGSMNIKDTLLNINLEVSGDILIGSDDINVNSVFYNLYVDDFLDYFNSNCKCYYRK